MAEQKQDGVSPAEDYYGRPTTTRGEPTEGLPPPERKADDEAEEETGNPRAKSSEERHPREDLDDLPDGDGPRSDRGTNPLPETYWSAFPDKKGKGS